jgi:molybdenum cofactor synthesis domain-containing protein
MRPFSSTISVTDALARLRDAARPVGDVERIELDSAAGRVCAEDVVAAADVPPFDRSAMDGYAVRSLDTARASPATPACLRLRGVTYTGDAAAGALASGECVEVATGAPLPPGADAVVMVERTRRPSPGAIEIMETAAPGQHVGRRGGDVRGGGGLLRAGDHLTPARLGALAASGLETVTVYRRPRVVVASTGNEVVLPGRPLGPGQIHDVNRFTLPPVIRTHGADVRLLPTIPDDVSAIEAALSAAADADLVVFTGGSSVGERDLVVDAVRARGVVVFHGVAMKPGKPTLFATLPRIGPTPAQAAERQLFLGLSGNPTSCLSNAYVLMVPVLRTLARLPPWRPQTVTVPLARAVTAGSGRHQFLPVRIEDGAAASVFKGSGEITSLSEAVGYIEIPADAERVEAGTMVGVVLF